MAQAAVELVPLAAPHASNTRTSPGPANDTATQSGSDTPRVDVSDDERERQISSLPPVDGGKDAWLFLAACFAIEALVWGFPFSFGVFQDHYSTHEPFAGQPNIAVIGTCAMGIMYLTAPLILGTARMFGRWTRWMPMFGLFFMCLALALSSFSQTVPHLIISQGIFYAIGGGIAYCPCILYMDEWFVNRKGLAYGIMWSGTGLAGVILPLMMESLLASIGFRMTLRLWSGLLFVLTAPLSFFIKPRLPVSTTVHAKPWNLRFMGMPSFIAYQAANIVEALGFFLPGIYLPMYARSAFGAQSYASASTVLLLNVASVFGCVVMGWFTDRFHVTTCIMLSTVGATLGVFLLWGLSASLPMLYAFCVVYGLFAGSFTSCWPGIMKDVIVRGDREKHGIIDPSMVFGWLAAGRGIGNIVSGPLSESLARGMPWEGQAGLGYGSGYGGLIVFTGVTALLGGGSWMWKRLGLL
ncbi:major facilitator superfamily domain-containing protein [Microdochium bolleyi]|uniref:Major facilitator superfamily domain-containing protein n=1 Tax=Microdochium bolleyi TaxID=196109 RepID=A0A136J152_9PEZI|nr:major facilitator superfamily domain-containing protein [Microdochium bolleyi]